MWLSQVRVNSGCCRGQLCTQNISHLIIANDNDTKLFAPLLTQMLIHKTKYERYRSTLLAAGGVLVTSGHYFWSKNEKSSNVRRNLNFQMQIKMIKTKKFILLCHCLRFPIFWVFDHGSAKMYTFYKFAARNLCFDRVGTDCIR